MLLPLVNYKLNIRMFEQCIFLLNLPIVPTGQLDKHTLPCLGAQLSIMHYSAIYIYIYI